MEQITDNIYALSQMGGMISYYVLLTGDVAAKLCSMAKKP